MPFLGKDWRSCGDEWIKTEQGWERIKVLECILDNLNNGLSKENVIRENVRNSLSLSRGEMNDGDMSLDASCSENLDTSLDSELDWPADQQEEDTFSEDSESNDDSMISIDQEKLFVQKIKKQNYSLRKLSISSSSIDKKFREKPMQPHIVYLGTVVDIYNRETNQPRASVSEVLNALDMPGAVKDIKRFNYVCKLVQLIINEKLNQLSGNAQRTLFLIVKEMLVQVIKTQENLNTMRKLLVDFKKAIQDSTNFYYFYHIGSQKLGDKHLATIKKWQKKLENPNSMRRLKRLSTSSTTLRRFNTNSNDSEQIYNKENDNTTSQRTLENIPFDCKLEIMRRLNTGLDIVNLSKCSRGLNDIITQELSMWKNLCNFHFQQAHINSLVNRTPNSMKTANQKIDEINELDWKSMYFKLKKRYGHREVYVDMIHQCFHCKCLFWREIGHPCVIIAGLGVDAQLDAKVEPITPKKLINLLQL